MAKNRHLAKQRRSRERLDYAIRSWAKLAKATAPGGTQFHTRGVNANGEPVEIIVTIAMLPTTEDEG